MSRERHDDELFPLHNGRAGGEGGGREQALNTHGKCVRLMSTVSYTIIVIGILQERTRLTSRASMHAHVFLFRSFFQRKHSGERDSTNTHYFVHN